MDRDLTNKVKFMILTKVFEISTRGKNKGKIKTTQLIDFKCDCCGKEIKRLYYKAIKQQKNCDYCCHKLKFIEYNKSCKGKTLEERLGKEKAEAAKEKMSEKLSYRRRIGDLKNQTWAKYNKSCKGKTLEERYNSEQKAEEIKKKISKATKGKNNPMYNKPSPTGSGNGWSGWYKGFYFRSLLELSFLIRNKENRISSAETFSIPYVDYAGSERTYHPDFIMDDSVIEVKPIKLVNTVNNKLKFEAAKKYFENKEYSFRILTEKEIIKLSKDEIISLHDNNEIKFLDRYELKYKEYINECSI